MSIAVFCPKCETRVEITRDIADQPVRCGRCGNTFVPGENDALAVGIQTKPAPTSPPSKLASILSPEPSPPRATARSPFPAVPLLICVVGLMFFLLIGSGGFNVWLMMSPNDPWRRQNDVNQANQRAAAAEARAQAEAAAARAAEMETQRVRKLLQDQVDELKQTLDATRKELDDIRRKEKAHAEPAPSILPQLCRHESQDWLVIEDGKSMKLTQGKNVLDFEISAF